MGKLKLQIAAILLSLFAAAFFCLVYLNIALLRTTVESLSAREGANTASQIAEFIKSSWPEKDFPGNLAAGKPGNRALIRYLGAVANLENLEIFTPDLKRVYAFQPQFAPFSQELLKQARQSGLTASGFFRPGPGGSYRQVESLSRELEGPVYYDTCLPLYRKGKIVCLLRLALDASRLPRLLSLTLTGNLMLALVFLLTAILAVSLWGENALSRPLRSIIEAQNQLGRGDFTARLSLPINPANELSQVAASFNQMAGELSSSQEQLQVKTGNLAALNLEYQQLNQQLEEKVELKTREMKEYFSIVTHDLKVPLAAIRGYSDLLLKNGEEPLAGKKRQFVKAVFLAATNSLDLLNNLMEAVRLETGRFQFELEEFDLKEAALEVEEHFRPAFEAKGVAYSCLIPDTVGRVKADRGKIIEVLLNLVGNALNFTPQGGEIKVSAHLRDGKAEIEVRDSGGGIPADFIPRIFDKFAGRAAGGTGLGLYIVKRILEEHGESIRVECPNEGGAVFAFTLPASD